jgi:acyl carrier protein
VFHSAGVVGEGASLSIEESGRDGCERQFRSKVDGLPVMAEVLGDRPLDFVLLNSSISSVLGGIGYAAYASANTFMDLFAHERRRHTGVPWTSVNWEGFGYGDAAPEGLPGATLTDLLIDPADAAVVLDRVLAGTLPAQIVNSTGDLTVRMDQWIDRTWRHADGAAEDGGASLHARPNVQTKFVALRTDEERRVAGIWRDLLGIDEIGLHDNFFELGGHSLIATRLVSRLADDLGVRIPLRVVLSKPTLAELVEAVRTADRPEEEAPVTPVARERYQIGRAPAAG